MHLSPGSLGSKLEAWEPQAPQNARVAAAKSAPARFAETAEPFRGLSLVELFSSLEQSMNDGVINDSMSFVTERGMLQGLCRDEDLYLTLALGPS